MAVHGHYERARRGLKLGVGVTSLHDMVLLYIIIIIHLIIDLIISCLLDEVDLHLLISLSSW